MKLNYRDRIILGVLLAIALLVASFFLLIKPKNEEIKTNKVTLADLEQQRDETDALIAEIPGIKTDITNAYNESKKLVADFVDYNDITNARKVDQYMQSFAEENEVKIMSVNPSGLGEGTLNYYYFTPSFVGEDQMTIADINGTMQKQKDEALAESQNLEARTSESVLSATYSVNVMAEDKENFWNYMKALEEQDETIIINSVTLTNIEIKEDKRISDDEKEDLIPTAQFNVTLYSMYEMEEPNLEIK